MVTKTYPELVKEHQALVAEVARLEANVAAERIRHFAELPTKFGFSDLDTFIQALRAAVSSAKPMRGGKKPAGGKLIPQNAPAKVARKPKSPVDVGTGAKPAPAAPAVKPPTDQVKKPEDEPASLPIIGHLSKSDTAVPPPASLEAKPSIPEAAPTIPAPEPKPIAPKPVAASVPQQAVSPAPTSASSASLDDPKNFTQEPDESVLTEPLDSKTLSESLKFAQRVLHTSGVPATTWRSWRQFEKKATEALRRVNHVGA